MRTISGPLSTAQGLAVRKPAYSLTKEEWFWKFTAGSSASLSGDYPHAKLPVSMWKKDSPAQLEFCGLSLAGNLNYYVQAISGGVVTPTLIVAAADAPSLRANFTPALELMYAKKKSGQVYPEIWQHGQGSAVAGGDIASFALTDTAALVKRVEAVSPVSPSIFLVALGTHDFSQKLSTVNFRLFLSGTYYPLRTMIQMDLPDPYVNRFAFQERCANVHMLQLGTGRFLFVAQDTANGRTIGWTWKDGVESQPHTIVPIDSTFADISFDLTGLYSIGGLYYITGVFTRKMDNGESVIYNSYLASADGLRWSIGERAHFVNSETALGSFAVNYAGSGTLYWAGGYQMYSAPQLASGVSIPLVGLSLSQQTNSGDSLDLTVPITASVAPMDILTLGMGYHDADDVATTATIGKYVVDTISQKVTTGGKALLSLSCRDLATAKLQSASPIDLEISSTVSAWSKISAFNKLIARAGASHATATASAMSFDGLNMPGVFYDGSRDDRDGLIRATARFLSTDEYSQSALALIWGMKDTEFSAFYIPKGSDWSEGWPGPRVLKSAITGWDLEDGNTNLFAGKLIAKLLAVPNATASGTYSVPSVNFNTASDVNYYDLAVRLNGNRVQLYQKLHGETTGNCSARASWNLVTEYAYSPHERKLWGGNLCGVAVGVDVPSSKSWFAQAEYGDMTLQLTEASDIYGLVPGNVKDHPALPHFQRNPCTGAGDNEDWFEVVDVLYNPRRDRVRVTAGNVSKLPVGLAVVAEARVRYSNGGVSAKDPHFGFIWATGADYVDVFLGGAGYGVAPSGETNRYRFKLLSDTETVFGQASSGYKTDTIYSTTVTTETGARKVPARVAGRGLFTSDSTVFTPRYIETDGLTHDLLSGSSTSRVGWEWTNPIGSPRAWRLLFNHGRFFVGTCASQGLPASGYMRADDEIVRFLEVSHEKGSVYPHLSDPSNAVTWCVIPTLYSSLNTAPTGSSNLTAWYNGSQYVGDTLSGTVGYLAEIVAKDSSGLSYAESSTQYYVAGASANGVTLSAPYPNAIVGAAPGKGDVLVLSGRGQHGTIKGFHSADAPVVYYPSSTLKPSFIDLHHYSSTRGTYNSVQNDIVACLAHFGVRSPSFSTVGAVTSLSTSDSAALTSKSDFSLSYSGHVPANGQKLQFKFRTKYQLDIWGEYTGTQAFLNCKLMMPDETDIELDYGERKLEYARVLVSDFNPFGSSLAGAHSEDLDKSHTMTVVVNGDWIQVQFQGQLVWRFNLAEHPVLSLSTGAVTASVSSGTLSDLTLSIPELDSEMESHIIDMGATGQSVLGYIIGERMIKTRTTPSGGLQIGRFWSPTHLSAVGGSLVLSDSGSDSGAGVAGHIRISGAQIGEHLDANWIQAHGYIFGSGQNRLLNTVSESVALAKLVARDDQEQSQSLAFDIPFLADAEVEDVLPVSFSVPGTLPGSRASVDMIIRSIQVQGSFAQLKGVYSGSVEVPYAP